MRRVLKSGGRPIFCEHGLAPDAGVRRMQNLINPLWRLICGGYNVNRDIPGLLGQGGFAIDSLETMYLRAAVRRIQLLGHGAGGVGEKAAGQKSVSGHKGPIE